MASADNLGKRVSLISMAVSGGLAVAKLVIGWIAGSNSVMADGVESAGDVLASGLILFGLWVAARPPDENHPYGHGRFETLTGLAVGIGLAMIGVLISWRSLQNIGADHTPPQLYAIWPLIASVLMKSGLSTYKFKVGRQIGSSALRADAWNDTVDILSGSVALVAVGLTLYDPSRFLAADHYGGAAVGLIVIVLGFQVIRETGLTLMDTMPDDGSIGEIRASALKVPGALDVEKCFARKTGLQYHVDLHLEVDPELTVLQGHSIAEEVRNQVRQDLDWVADVLVHVEPHGGCGYHGKH
ncbi:MAG TPA: cation diffusion facilitator family transporter [Paludibaculum sp.]